MNCKSKSRELRRLSCRSSPVRNELRARHRRRILLVKVFGSGGMTGYGECVAGDSPFYNHETIDTAWLMTTKYIVPCWRRSGSRVRRRCATRWLRFARTGWQRPGWRPPSGTSKRNRLNSPCGDISGAPGPRSRAACPSACRIRRRLLDKVSDALECGYPEDQIKIKPGKDAQLVEAVRGQFPDVTLSVDANAAYSLVTDSPLFARLDEFGLLMIEQPLAPATSSIMPSYSARPHVDLSR